jgi:tRNA G10  N-methylase Trm11
MKTVLVADDRLVRVYRVCWKDVQLVESERVIQAPIIQAADHSKVIDRRKEKKPFFKSGTKGRQ